MAKAEKIKLGANISFKCDKILRKQAFDMKWTLGEVIELYQEVYLEKEKAEKKNKKNLEKSEEENK